MPPLFVHASHPTAGIQGKGKKERCTEEGRRERESRVSGSVGRVTERFRVPLAPALTRLPDTVTSVDPRVYPPRAVSPFSLKHAARSTGRETVCAANSSNRGKIAIPKARTPRRMRDGFMRGLPCSLFLLVHAYRLLIPRTGQFRLHQRLIHCYGLWVTAVVVSRSIAADAWLGFYALRLHRATVNRGRIMGIIFRGKFRFRKFKFEFEEFISFDSLKHTLFFLLTFK